MPVHELIRDNRSKQSTKDLTPAHPDAFRNSLVKALNNLAAITTAAGQEAAAQIIRLEASQFESAPLRDAP